MLTLQTLPHKIQSGDVDTVVVAFPDLQGRPVGKRVTGAFFIEHVLHHGIEVCDYLLACDVDMEPLPGYRFANWDTGYGDLNAVIDPQTVRPLPWLPGSVLVLCDLLTMDGDPVEVSPRRILRRQLERAAALGLEVKCATELEFYLFLDSFTEASGKHWQGLVPHADTIEDYQLLQTSREEYVIAKIRNQMIEAGIPIEFSKGEAGIGQHEINITYAGALEVAGRHLHGQVVDGHRRILVSHPHQPVGCRHRCPADGPGRGRGPALWLLGDRTAVRGRATIRRRAVGLVRV